MDEPDATEEAAVYECALAELLAEGVDADARPTVAAYVAEPEHLEAAFKKLTPEQQERLSAQFLPEFDRLRDDRLRNPALSEALRLFTASLTVTPTPAAGRCSCHCRTGACSICGAEVSGWWFT